MSIIYVARSKTLSDWGASVGISKNLFKVGVDSGTGKEAVTALNEAACAGITDWTLVKAEGAEELSETEALERLERKERVVDPKYYPHIKGAPGIFRVKLENVENSLLVERTLSGEGSRSVKIKPADVAGYLIKNGRG
ncbi:MAG: hypothetical protein ACE5Q3_10550 [Alphaproteobacteria bacterium]